MLKIVTKYLEKGMISIPILTASFVRRVRSIKRRSLGGATPEWATNVFAVAKVLWTPLKLLLAVALLPTLIVLTFSPKHFFRRLPAILKSKRGLYKSPVSFTLEATGAIAAALVLVLPSLGLERIRTQIIQGMLLTAVVFSPIGIYFLLLLMRCIMFTAHGLIFVFWRELFKRISADLNLCLFPSTYVRLNWKVFAYGLIMLDVYLFLAVGFLSMAAIVWLWLAGQLLDLEQSNGALVPLAVLGYFLVARIYMRLLYASMSVPPVALMQHDVEEMNDLLSKMRTESTMNLAVEIRRLWAGLRFDLRRFEASAGKRLSAHLLERSSAYSQLYTYKLDSMIERLTTMGEDALPLTRVRDEVVRVAKGQPIFPQCESSTKASAGA